MKRFLYLLVTILLISQSFIADAQKWRTERRNWVFATGTNHFMGDLGGGKKDAAHFLGVRDLDFVTTRPLLQVGFRYRLNPMIAVRANFSYALLSGKDKASGNLYRKARNLSFYSNIYELSGHVEYAFIKEKENPRYSFSSLRTVRNISVYMFAGVGVFMYNPKAKYDGKWYKLRDMHTEGQGLSYTYLNTNGETVTDFGPKPYGRFALAIPIGLGAKYKIDRRWSIGLEISARYTSTDYLDDAGGSYFDNATIQANYGDVAAALADRHFDVVTNADGSLGMAPAIAPKPHGRKMRGNPDYNDAYIFTAITLHYKIKNSGSAQPKFN